MKIGDLVTFSPEAWGTPLEDRPLGVVTDVETRHDATEMETLQMVTVLFARDDIPYSSRRTDFEVVNENW